MTNSEETAYEMQTLFINITQDDLNAGVIESCAKCPAAIAINRVLNTKIHVIGPYFNIGSETILRIWDTAGQLRDFVNKFDTQRNKVRPITIAIRIPILYKTLLDRKVNIDIWAHTGRTVQKD